MNIDSLLDESFLDAMAVHATATIEQARDQVGAVGQVEPFDVEIVIPDDADETWLRERVLRPLIYLCQSRGVPPPACPGVFVTFFRDDHLHCVLAAEVLAWGAQTLGMDTKTLVDRYGLGEYGQAAPRAPA